MDNKARLYHFQNLKSIKTFSYHGNPLQLVVIACSHEHAKLEAQRLIRDELLNRYGPAPGPVMTDVMKCIMHAATQEIEQQMPGIADSGGVIITT
jgi:hypothetical protein